jgi:hypothetical protein
MSTVAFRHVALFGVTLASCAIAAAACSSSSDGDNTLPLGTGGVAGMTAVGGAAGTIASGGSTMMMMTGTGGTTVGMGGSVVASGGVPTGGAPAGGMVGSGGMPGTGGTMVSIGGQSNASDIKITGSSTLCMGAMPMIPSTPLSACTADHCSGAHCVSMAEIPMGADVTQLAKCSDGVYCTPDDYVATQGKFLVKSCTSLEGAEGRCISTCVPQVATQIDQLPKDVCMDTERCAPCYNPIDGTDTKACTQGCDTGPTKPAVTFAKCGIYAMDSTMTPRGLCVPKSLVPMDLQSIPQDTCKTDELCAPTEKVKDLNYNFPQCTPTSLGGGLGMANMAGQKAGCVPAYLTGTSAGLLLQDGCMAGYLCAPCTNPLSTPTANAPTGACPWP